MPARTPEETAARPAAAAPPGCWGVLLGLAALKLVLHAAVGSGYGFHQDEFYYLACGRRPAWGYVDQPPLVPMLGRLAESLFGAGMMTSGELRWLSALAGAGAVFLGGLMARELGGRRYAQGLAALAVLSMPLFLATGELFQTVVFDELAWSLACWLTLRTLRDARGRGWLWVGLAAGAGLEIKFTMSLFGLGLAVALLATRTGRSHLRTPWPWAGGALALALLLPNLLWQRAHGWPTAEFIHNNNAWNRKEWTPAGFLLLQALFAGTALGLVALGAWWCGSRRATPATRAALWIAGTAAAALLLLRGKPYYLGPIYPMLAAAGSVAAEELTRGWNMPGVGSRGRRWLRPGVVLALVLGALLLGPVALPIVPLARLAGSRTLRLNPDLAAHVGWPELVAQVEAVVRGLPAAEQARTTILSVNYEEAAAIEHYAPALAARLPVVSPHNSYWLWGPGGQGDPQTVVVVGARQQGWQEELFGRVERVATIATPWGITNEWTGRGIFVCREPKKTLRAAWPDLKSFE